MNLKKEGKTNLRNEFVLVLIIFLIASVAALQGNSSSYTSDTKLDFGATDNANSNSYSNEFISGFEPVSIYSSTLYTGRFGVLGDAANVSLTPLVISNILINSTDGSNKTLQDLHCSATIFNDVENKMNISVKWYKNSVEVLSYSYNNNYENGTYFVADLSYTNTGKGQNWSCALRIFDGNYYSSWAHSENLIIVNTIPTTTLSSPSNGFSTIDRTPTFNWVGEDDDNDDITYDFNISLVASSLCTDSDKFIEDISTNTYTTSALNCFFDNGDYYIWSVRAKDDESTGEWENYYNINISVLIDISVPVSSVSFGEIPYLGSDNTTDNSPLPFVIQNNGNSFINLNISATDLWDIVSNPTEYYKIKVDNVSGEEGAFNWTGSTVDWVNVPAIGDTIFIDKLNYLDYIDSAEIDIYVQVPVNEIPTAKSSTITFVSSFDE